MSHLLLRDHHVLCFYPNASRVYEALVVHNQEETSPLVTENTLFFFDDSVYIIHFDLCTVRGSTRVYRAWSKLHSSVLFENCSYRLCIFSEEMKWILHVDCKRGAHLWHAKCVLGMIFPVSNLLTCSEGQRLIRMRSCCSHHQCPEMVPGWAWRVKLTVTQLSWQSSSVLVSFPNTATNSPECTINLPSLLLAPLMKKRLLLIFTHHLLNILKNFYWWCNSTHFENIMMKLHLLFNKMLIE